MKISVFGLGYVGAVSGACLAKSGHQVIGVDVSQAKVDIINNGECPIVEPGLPELITEVTGSGALSATTNAADAINQCDITMIAVGTPSDDTGNVNLDAVKGCLADLSELLANKTDYHVVVIRSTVPPGTTDSLINVTPEIRKAVDEGRIGFVMNPEFLREGSSIDDFLYPEVTIIGESSEKAGEFVESLYSFIDAPVVHLSLPAAEMIKYVNNCFHALKVTFANEVGAVCKELDIDSHAVMDVVCMDTKLNISRKYLMPGFAFGGSCLPKDLRALNHIARHRDLELPLLDSMLPSNQNLIERTAQRVQKYGARKVGMLGLSFKRNTDDLRESPFVTLAEQLIGKGYDLKAFDKNVSVSKLIGSNQAYVEQHLPHIDSVLSESVEDVAAHAEVLIVCNYEPEYQTCLAAYKDDKVIIDLARLPDDLRNGEKYDGLAW